MSDVKKLFLVVFSWIVTVSGLHLWLNVDWETIWNDRLPENQRKLHIAYIPVT
jgi:hypothetical protein